MNPKNIYKYKCCESDILLKLYYIFSEYFLNSAAQIDQYSWEIPTRNKDFIQQ